MTDEYVQLLFYLSDDMQGHATRKILKVLDEDEESLLCNDLFDLSGTPSVVLEKRQEYVPDIRNTSSIKCWGTDERIVDYILHKAWYKKLQEDGIDENDIDMRYLRRMIQPIDNKIVAISQYIL